MKARYGARVAVNTRLLYVRLAIVKVVDLFVARDLLGSLGVGEYGDFTVVTAWVAACFFFIGALDGAARRFVCADRRNFSPLLGWTATVVGAVGLLGAGAAVWESGRLAEVKLLVLGMFALQALRLPYEALVVASERMGFLLVLSVVESLLTLGSALAIRLLPMPPLTAYAVLRLSSAALVWALAFFYCRRHHVESRVPPVFSFSRVRPLFGFFGWQTLGSVAVFLRASGIVLLLSALAGAGACAACETGGVVMGTLWGLVANYRMAYQPGIVKAWTDGDRGSFVSCTARAFRHSVIGMTLVVLPIVIWTPMLCRVWLGTDVPPGADMFVRMFALQCLFEAFATPLDTAILATGRIARYEIDLTLLIGSSFALAWLFLSVGFPPWTSIGAAALVNVFACLYRFVHLKLHHGVAIRAWFCQSAA